MRILIRSARYFLLPACGLILFSSGGCVALPLATLGTVLGFAGSAASTGSDVYNLGKLDFSTMASYEQSRDAVVAASNDLQLHIMKTEPVGKRPDEVVYELTDDRGRKLDVRVDRRAGNLCQCRVDVGIFGFEPTAKLVMDRMRAHLPATEMNPTFAPATAATRSSQ